MSGENSGDDGGKVAQIVDRAEAEGLATADALEDFWREGGFTYSFPSIRSELVEVVMTDGSRVPVVTALEEGAVTIADVVDAGVFVWMTDDLTGKTFRAAERDAYTVTGVVRDGSAAQNSELAVLASDDKYDYIPRLTASAYEVVFADGSRLPLAEALGSGRAVMAELATQFDYFAYEKATGAYWLTEGDERTEFALTVNSDGHEELVPSYLIGTLDTEEPVSDSDAEASLSTNTASGGATPQSSSAQSTSARSGDKGYSDELEHVDSSDEWRMYYSDTSGGIGNIPGGGGSPQISGAPAPSDLSSLIRKT